MKEEFFLINQESLSNLTISVNGVKNEEEKNRKKRRRNMYRTK